jgi:hypothetical protein
MQGASALGSAARPRAAAPPRAAAAAAAAAAVAAAAARRRAAPRPPRAAAPQAPQAGGVELPSSAARRGAPPAAVKRGVSESIAMPDAVLAQVRDANSAWIEWAVSHPLDHPSGARVYLAPCCCWAPLQWCALWDPGGGRPCACCALASRARPSPSPPPAPPRRRAGRSCARCLRRRAPRPSRLSSRRRRSVCRRCPHGSPPSWARLIPSCARRTCPPTCPAAAPAAGAAQAEAAAKAGAAAAAARLAAAPPARWQRCASRSARRRRARATRAWGATSSTPVRVAPAVGEWGQEGHSAPDSEARRGRQAPLQRTRSGVASAAPSPLATSPPPLPLPPPAHRRDVWLLRR